MKAVLIMRGLPGSGKSTLAREMAQAVPSSEIFSADDFFNGGPFDPRAIGYAHMDCQRRFGEALQRGISLAIVDNTNTTVGEIRPYVEAAQTFGYEFTILEVPCDIETSVARNIHSCPRENIEVMDNRMRTSPLDPNWPIVRYGG